MALEPVSHLSTVFCLLLWQTAADGSWRNATENLGGGSSTALVARLRCIKLSQGEFGSGPARCDQDATQGSKYERRAASSTDSTAAPLRPGSLCRAAHNLSAQRRREAAESGRQEPLRCPGGKPEEAAMARCGNRPQREHRKGRRGRKGPFWCFCLRGTGNKDKVLTV
ncbi:uncharacterized protein TrAtP1_012827 [Trichoderma atroviride]|uniref:uncharacterized protein n=1 Tax=Hypocrea atroviridis TaxID=63577 RepID=UPI00332E039C|nr:hypothetical protein TrAtP1_012827 [Trichoderma atroviride]